MCHKTLFSHTEHPSGVGSIAALYSYGLDSDLSLETNYSDWVFFSVPPGLDVVA
jgi:hypothetical protein